MNWQLFNPFERLVFILGIILLCTIIGLIFGAVCLMIENVTGNRAKKRAQRKKVASEPVNGMNWLVYDCTGRIKQNGHELRELTRKGGNQNDKGV